MQLKSPVRRTRALPQGSGELPSLPLPPKPSLHPYFATNLATCETTHGDNHIFLPCWAFCARQIVLCLSQTDQARYGGIMVIVCNDEDLWWIWNLKTRPRPLHPCRTENWAPLASGVVELDRLMITPVT